MKQLVRSCCLIIQKVFFKDFDAQAQNALTQTHKAVLRAMQSENYVLARQLCMNAINDFDKQYHAYYYFILGNLCRIDDDLASAVMYYNKSLEHFPYKSFFKPYFFVQLLHNGFMAAIEMNDCETAATFYVLHKSSYNTRFLYSKYNKELLQRWHKSFNNIYSNTCIK